MKKFKITPSGKIFSFCGKFTADKIKARNGQALILRYNNKNIQKFEITKYHLTFSKIDETFHHGVIYPLYG
jgi:acyl CoA:acetate/3-ketoacid CoA transferase